MLIVPSVPPVTVIVCGVSQLPVPALVKVTDESGGTLPAVGVSLANEIVTLALGCEFKRMVKVAVVPGVVEQVVGVTNTPSVSSSRFVSVTGGGAAAP